MSVAITKAMLEEYLSVIVGPENVSSDPKVLEKYSRDNSFVPPRMPLCIVRPGTVEEIQEVMRFANRYLVPLVPYVTGKNNQGTAIPSVPAIIVDVGRLNKILEVDAGARVVIVEPAVTFTQLQEEAKKYGYRALTPMEHPASASALITTIEMVPLYAWPRYETEIAMTLQAVVPATCGILKTGTWGVEGCNTPYEPGDTFMSFLSKLWLGAQGTLGIIVKGVLKLKTIQESNRVLFLPFKKLNDALKVMQRIRRLETGEELFVVNNFELTLLVARDILKEFENIRKNQAPWMLVHILRGPRGEVDYQEADIKDLTSELGVKMIYDLPEVSDAPERILSEIQNPQGWEKTSKYKGARNTVPFITVVERTPTYSEEVLKLAKKHGYPEEDVGCTFLPIRTGPIHCQYSFHRNPEDSKDTEKVKALYSEVGARLIEMNAFFSRPYPLFAGIVYQRAARYHSIVRKIKNAHDPNYIMNPGKLAL